MSLNVASSIATGSLSATQSQLAVTAANIANADTDGYTRKEATVSSTTTSGVGTGVEVSGLTSKVSQLLISDLADATSVAASATATADYLDQLQTAMGSTSNSDESGTSLANQIATLETALSDLVNTPESTTLAATAVTELDELASQLRSTSASVQDLREDADSAIEDSVATANDAITTISDLNDQILTASARGESTADLEDQRNQALVTLSEQLGVTSFISDNGTMKVYTTSGQVLVGNSTHYLDFDSSNIVTSDRTYDGTSSGLSGVTVDGADITGDINSGTIGALLTLRDETLPAVQDTLDELASGLIDELNTVSPGLLSGSDASDIAVSDSILATPTAILGTSGQASTAQALLGAVQGDTDFAAAGSFGDTSTTFADYASDILTDVVSKATSATSKLDTATTALETVSDSISSLYGVNIDEETARMSELETLYSASAQLLSTVQDMFESLLAAVA
ncbi:flagellar hook-associated protein 1 FlgK [Breoghania corrubedonensis]|uniref:Flagellar hook-associated protein 1 n=1 Tax=Breoghania corrubedonensis TaxID=665038 RepID=A0A2T5V6E8_9HYPH|nr:flagellar hook-associated protein FlgK [Breoghania corrubedonensis]PTW59328.1 flagellar hook-associated protein 1 FlgK [Breoghania corrubedonensis]